MGCLCVMAMNSSCYKIVFVFVAYLVVCTDFQFASFPTYKEEFRNIFELSLDQADGVQRVSELGYVGAILGAILVTSCGLRCACAVGLFVSVSCFSLICFATQHVEFYKNNTWLLLSYFFLTGTANGMSLVATLSAVIRVFNGRLRAVVLALIVSAADVGPLIYSLCFELWFKVAPEDYYSRPDIVRYLVLVTASKGLIHLLGILVFSGMPSGDDADVNERTQLVTKDNTVDKTCDNKCDTSDEKTESEESNGKSQRKLSTYNGHCDELGIFDVVKKLQFHVIMWPAAVLIGLKFTSAKNLNLYLLSFKWMETSLPFTGAASLFCLFTLPLVAIISELGSPPFSRSLLLVGASIIAIICYITAIYYLDNIYILSLNVMFWTLSADIALALQPLLHIDEFGDQTFVINNGFLLAGMAVVMAVSQYWFGAFYRLNWIQDDMVCYGLECYMWTFVVGACITAICLVVILINTCRYYKRYNERDHEPARTDNSR